MNYVHVTALTSALTPPATIVVAVPVDSVKPLVRAGIVSFIDGNYFSGAYAGFILQAPGAFLPNVIR